MKRIVLTDGTGRWFDLEKAQDWEEDTRWNGNNHVSLATGSQWDHEHLYRTAGGVYILHHWSQWQGSVPTYEEMSRKDAAAWLSVNGHGSGVARSAGVETEYAALEVP